MCKGLKGGLPTMSNFIEMMALLKEVPTSKAKRMDIGEVIYSIEGRMYLANTNVEWIASEDDLLAEDWIVYR